MDTPTTANSQSISVRGSSEEEARIEVFYQLRVAYTPEATQARVTKWFGTTPSPGIGNDSTRGYSQDYVVPPELSVPSNSWPRAETSSAASIPVDIAEAYQATCIGVSLPFVAGSDEDRPPGYKIPIDEQSKDLDVRQPMRQLLRPPIDLKPKSSCAVYSDSKSEPRSSKSPGHATFVQVKHLKSVPQFLPGPSSRVASNDPRRSNRRKFKESCSSALKGPVYCLPHMYLASC